MFESQEPRVVSKKEEAKAKREVTAMKKEARRLAPRKGTFRS